MRVLYVITIAFRVYMSFTYNWVSPVCGILFVWRSHTNSMFRLFHFLFRRELFRRELFLFHPSSIPCVPVPS